MSINHAQGDTWTKTCSSQVEGVETHASSMPGSGVSNDSDSLPTLSLSHFDGALDLIDNGEKACYVEAMKRCSSTVFENECHPEFFLRACGFNPWQAAQKMCDYWRERVALFGHDRAFNPLTATTSDVSVSGMKGEASLQSALTPEDIEILETGSVQLLPPDRDGRSVLFFDRSRLKPHMHHLTKPRMRALWYVMNRALSCQGKNNFSAGTASSNVKGDQQQHHCIVGLALLVRPPGSGYDWQFPTLCARIGNCLPVIICDIHLLTLPAASGTGRLLQTVVNTTINMLGSYLGQKSLLHQVDTSSDALIKLKKCKFSKRGLPAVAGGSWDGFDQWLGRVRRKEKVVYATTNQLQERRRQINKVHSVKKRQRRKREFEELNETVASLREEHAAAKAEERRLGELLDRARSIIANWQNQEQSFEHQHVSMPGTMDRVDAFPSQSLYASSTNFHHMPTNDTTFVAAGMVENSAFNQEIEHTFAASDNSSDPVASSRLPAIESRSESFLHPFSEVHPMPTEAGVSSMPFADHLDMTSMHHGSADISQPLSLHDDGMLLMDDAPLCHGHNLDPTQTFQTIQSDLINTSTNFEDMHSDAKLHVDLDIEPLPFSKQEEFWSQRTTSPRISDVQYHGLYEKSTQSVRTEATEEAWNLGPPEQVNNAYGHFTFSDKIVSKDSHGSVDPENSHAQLSALSMMNMNIPASTMTWVDSASGNRIQKRNPEHNIAYFISNGVGE